MEIALAPTRIDYYRMLGLVYRQVMDGLAGSTGQTVDVFA